MPPNTELTSTVATSYNQIAEQYTEWVGNFPSARLIYADKFLTHLPDSPNKSTILELGCGAGVPVTQYLASSPKVGQVIANDVSAKQIELARGKVVYSDEVKVKFVVGDMLALEFEDGSLDGVVAFFCLFHLPVLDQAEMLKMIYAWLKPGGALICNFGAAADDVVHVGEENEVLTGLTGVESRDEGSWGDFFGAELFWSNAGTERNLQMIKDAGFEEVNYEVLNMDGCRAHSTDYNPDAGLEFLWVVAKKCG